MRGRSTGPPSTGVIVLVMAAGLITVARHVHVNWPESLLTVALGIAVIVCIALMVQLNRGDPA